MSVEIDGVKYLSATEVADDVGVTRQTIWRWRNEAKIPQGHRFRNRQVLFTESEVEAIREFAFRVEPIDSGDARQTKLFLRR